MYFYICTLPKPLTTTLSTPWFEKVFDFSDIYRLSDFVERRFVVQSFVATHQTLLAVYLPKLEPEQRLNVRNRPEKSNIYLEVRVTTL